MSEWCTCLRGGPRDPDCPLAPAHESMDQFAADMRQMAADTTAAMNAARDRLTAPTREDNLTWS